MIKEALFELHYDPYDIWASPRLGAAKLGFYRGDFLARVQCVLIALMDYAAPALLREVLRVRRSMAAHTRALLWLSGRISTSSSPDHDAADKALLDVLDITAIQVASGIGWGLPFAWWSKNGMYPANTAYITNTPYVMECLLALRQSPSCTNKATDLFNNTFDFLGELKRHINTNECLALSYAAIDEPRLVINGNSYAMFAYAMHASFGVQNRQMVAKDNALRLASWIVSMQSPDGSWWYYADSENGNFIDCFHSCFIIKNMVKTIKLCPEANSICSNSLERGWEFIRRFLFDKKSGLCRRFIAHNFRDPFIWDIYDQAEYLGLLVDFGLLDDALSLCTKVRQRFLHHGNWYVRIDFLNRRWGKNFLRWGIVPFLFNEARLATALKSKASESGSPLDTNNIKIQGVA